MRTSLNESIAQHTYSDIRKLNQYIWQLEDEVAELRAQNKSLAREKNNEFVENTILRSQVQILNLMGI
jgi:hypothetical protein